MATETQSKPLVLPPSVEVLIGDKEGWGELGRRWGRGNGGLEEEKGSWVGEEGRGWGRNKGEKKEGERKACQRPLSRISFSYAPAVKLPSEEY